MISLCPPVKLDSSLQGAGVRQHWCQRPALWCPAAARREQHLLRRPSSATMRVGNASLFTVVCRISVSMLGILYVLMSPAEGATRQASAPAGEMAQAAGQEAGTRRFRS